MREAKKRTLYECSHARVKGDRIYCQKGHQLLKKAADGSGNLDPGVQERLLKNLEERALQNLEKLEVLPGDVGGRIKELNQYDFMDGEARRQFQELMDMLKRNAMSSFAKEMTQTLKNMDADSLAAMRHFMEAINQDAPVGPAHRAEG